MPNYTITQNSKKDIYKRNIKHFTSKKLLQIKKKVNWDNTLNAFESNVNKSFWSFSDKIKYTWQTCAYHKEILKSRKHYLQELY